MHHLMTWCDCVRVGNEASESDRFAKAVQAGKHSHPDAFRRTVEASVSMTPRGRCYQFVGDVSFCNAGDGLRAVAEKTKGVTRKTRNALCF